MGYILILKGWHMKINPKEMRIGCDEIDSLS